MMINKLRDFICFNQGQLLQYEYLIAKKHKILKEYLNEIECKKINILSEVEKDKLVNILTDLYINSEKELLSILEKNFIKILSIFNIEDLSYTVELLDFNENDKNVIYRFFDSSTEIDINNQKSSLISQNIALDNIITYGKQDFINSEQKSIIIPMTLRANENLTSEFRDSFFTKESESKIWGFIYFNSPNTLFSNEHLDICHIISDTLSLYFMFFHDHIEGSNSFSEALDLIGD